MKEKQKRKVRAYKIVDTAYNAAIRKSKKSTPLATKVEQIVTAIGEGKEIVITDKK